MTRITQRATLPPRAVDIDLALMGIISTEEFTEEQLDGRGGLRLGVMANLAVARSLPGTRPVGLVEVRAWRGAT